MISAGKVTCPAGKVVLQRPEGAVHSDEPAFYIDKTEEPQGEFMEFLKKWNESAYFEVSKLLDNHLELKGDKKPAIYVMMSEARAYCRAKYQDGDLPTERQWENACGREKGRFSTDLQQEVYCTTSEELNRTEAIYSTSWPADVDSSGAEKRVNKRGVQDMTGNAREWVRDNVSADQKHIRGGSWLYANLDSRLHANIRGDLPLPSDPRAKDIGFRCIAPVLGKAR